MADKASGHIELKIDFEQDSGGPTPPPKKSSPLWLAVAFVLGMAGLALILAALIGWQFPQPDKTVVHDTTTTTTASAARVKSADKSLDGTIGTVSETKKDSTTDTTVHHSDTVTVAVLTAGMVLLIAGAFFPRIQKLSFGGAEVVIGPLVVQQLTELVAARVVQQRGLVATNVAPAVGKAVAYALEDIRDRISSGEVTTPAALTTEYLTGIAEAAVERAANEPEA